MKIQKGSRVKIDYEGTLDDGSVFDSTLHGNHSHPLEFEIGKSQVLPAFESELINLEEGQEKTFIIEAKDAYGTHKSELQKEIPRSSLSLEKNPEAGMFLMVKSPDGREVPLPIIKVAPETITLDLNHPLAGKRLHFRIKVLSVGN